MNRREFLKNTGKFSLAVSLSGSVFPLLADQNKPFFKLSLAQWSLHRAFESKLLDPMDFATIAKGYGFEGLEYVNGFYAPENTQQPLDKTIKELLKRSSGSGMHNLLIMVDNEGELAALDKKQRDFAISSHAKWINAAAILGCHSIRVNLFGRGAEKDFSLWKETSIDGLGRLSELAGKSGINVLVENHGGLSSDAAKLIEVIKQINLPNCGTLPDFGNFCVERDSGERWEGKCILEYDSYKGVAELLPFAKGVSAKSYDFDAQGNESQIDYKKMLQLVKASGYSGFIGVEYEGNRLSEEQGILATKKLLLRLASAL